MVRRARPGLRLPEERLAREHQVPERVPEVERLARHEREDQAPARPQRLALVVPAPVVPLPAHPLRAVAAVAVPTCRSTTMAGPVARPTRS